MRAFAGESQARSRYLFAAGLAKRQNLQVIEAVFTFTANQEQAHAKVFYDLLAPSAGENIRVDGNYPVDLSSSVAELLRMAQHNEYQEHRVEYANFSKAAYEEGFSEIGKTFEMIADVEKTHGDRFGRFADALEQEKLFVSDVEVQWMCLNCGRIINATMAPAACPVCRHPQGYFLRLELTPFQP